MKKIEILENGNVRVTIPIALRNCAGRKKIITSDTPAGGGESLSTTIARAFRWQRYIDEGKFKNAADLAKAIGIAQGVVSWTLRLTLLAPEIIHRVLNNNTPPGLTITRLREAIPDLWDEQLDFFEK